MTSSAVNTQRFDRRFEEAKPVVAAADMHWLQTEVERAKYSPTIKLGLKITPKLASAMLLRNDRNRHVYERHVQTLVMAIERGEYVQTHEGIAFDTLGRLLDGQHRLHAVILSGLAIDCDVHFGRPPETFDRINVGKPRTAANVLEIAGAKFTTASAAAARCLLSIRAGRTYVDRAITQHQIVECVQQTPRLIKAVKVAENVRVSIGHKISMAGVAVGSFFLDEAVGVEQDPFIEKLKTGVGFNNKQDPVLRLRERLTKGGGKDSRVNPVETAALMIKAFNYWTEGRPIQVLIWRAVDELFPRVGG